jgi:hypothetical protein
MLLIPAFCRFPGLIMTQMANIAFYATSARSFLLALKLVSRFVSLDCDQRWQPVLGAIRRLEWLRWEGYVVPNRKSYAVPHNQEDLC